MLGGLSIKMIGTIMDLFLPWILSKIIDDVVPQRDIRQILLWGGAMVFCAVAAVVTNIIANRMASKVAMLTTKAVRHDLFTKISYLSCRQVDQFTVSSLESRLTTDTYHVHQMIGMMQRLGIRAPILLLGGIMITLTLDPVLTLVLLSVLPFIGGLVYLITKKGIPLYLLLQKGIDALVRTVRENITGIRVIKALSKTEYEKQRFQKVNREVVAREERAGMTMAFTNPLMNVFLNLGLTAVILVGAFRVNTGLTQSGKIIAFLTYFTIILNAMLSITRMFVMYSKGSAAAGRIGEVLHAEEDMAVRPEDSIDTPYHIIFSHVTFSYHKMQDNLSDISFQLKRGDVLGLIGATGCGKSTIAALLMRLYDTDTGEIRISGQQVNTIPEERLHTMFGVTFQNDALFADTIYENIDFGRRLPREQILLAAECAQAMEFIEALPDRFDHMLTQKGTNLSGGQKQRLLIARALAGAPEILILDDASSALDYKTDAKMRRAIAAHYSGTTTIIIAQRISSILHADRILVLDEGRIAGSGTHEELLKSCEIYREISQSQMGGMHDGQDAARNS